MKFNITTFNIRRDNGKDGINCFKFRKDLIKTTIKKYNSDIIAFQEVLPHVYRWLKQTLYKEYTVVGCGRDKNLSDEHMILAFKTDKYDLLEMTTKWLSDTPNIAGTRYKEQSICPRIYTKFLLRDILENKIFCVYLTHLDHEKEYARQQGIRQIVKDMNIDRKTYSVPSILLGDFNEQSDVFNIDNILKDSEISLTDVSKNSGITFHNYGVKDEQVGKIDYIFTTDEFTGGNVILWDDCENGIYLSDHYPVSVNLEL